MPNGNFSTLQIGFIVAADGAPMTGSERYYFDLLRSLPPLGVSNRGLVVGDLSAVADPVPGVESFAPERGGARSRIVHLRRAVRRLAPDVDLVTTHSPAHAWPVLDIIRNKPLVMHFHGPLVLESIAEGKSTKRVMLARFAETLTYARAKRFIVLSQANATTLHEQYRVPEKLIRIVPGAVDTHRFAPALSASEARAKLGWPQGRPIAISVRRLAATKGIENLIDAIALVRSAVPDVFVALVGAGPLRAELERRVSALGLENNVRFEGQLGETLPLAYRAADVSIVPSVALEGFGLSVVESLACGTPALVTPVTGLPEVVRDLDERLVLAGKEPAELARGLIDAFSNPASLPGEAACLAYVKRFAWPSIAARIKTVYEEVL